MQEGPESFTEQQLIVQGEIASEQEHENGNHDVHCHAVKMPDTGAEITESAGAGCTEGMDNRIIRRDPAEDQGDEFQQREADIQGIEHFGCFAGLRNELAEGRARAFGLDQVGRPSGQLRQQGEREYQNTHAADPVGCGAPEHNSARKAFKPGQNGGSCCGKTGNRFEKSILKPGIDAGNKEWERTAKRHQNPAERGNDKSFLQAQVTAGKRRGKHQQHSAGKGYDQDAEPHDGCIPVTVNEGDSQGRQHGSRFHQQDRAQDADNQPSVHR